MRLPRFDYHQPATVWEACQIMAEYGPSARLIAGGTDLMVNMKRQVIRPDHVVSIGHLEALKTLEIDSRQVRIGACVTVAELAESESMKTHVPALVQGARNLGTPLIRNLATIGGNLGSARPAADMPPSLIAYGAKVVLESTKGQREVSLDHFFVGPGLTEIQPMEVLREIIVDIPGPGAGAGYLNLGMRKAQDCNLVNVASFIRLADDEKTISEARVVMGCVGPTHLPSPGAEKVLVGAQVSEALFEQAAQAATQDARPIDDFRGCAEYKRDMVGVLTRRTLAMALENARNSKN